jgi:hypothetical protein
MRPKKSIEPKLVEENAKVLRDARTELGLSQLDLAERARAGLDEIRMLELDGWSSDAAATFLSVFDVHIVNQTYTRIGQALKDERERQRAVDNQRLSSARTERPQPSGKRPNARR